MTLRVLDTGLSPARWNVAASAALLESVDAGAPAVLRFHRYLPSCVFGRFQDVAAELDTDACREDGIVMARRVTGGGAVVMGPGILAFDLVLPIGGETMHAVTHRVGEALVATLADLGLSGTRPTSGSVSIGGLKVSGSAGRLARRALLHQATLILDLTEAPPLSLLRRRTEGGRLTDDPRHRVTDLNTALRVASRPSVEMTGADGTPPLGDVVKRHLTRRIAEAIGRAVHPDTMSDAERLVAASILAERVGREDFVLTGDVERRAA